MAVRYNPRSPNTHREVHVHKLARDDMRTSHFPKTTIEPWLVALLLVLMTVWTRRCW